MYTNTGLGIFYHITPFFHNALSFVKAFILFWRFLNGERSERSIRVAISFSLSREERARYARCSLSLSALYQERGAGKICDNMCRRSIMKSEERSERDMRIALSRREEC